VWKERITKNEKEENFQHNGAYLDWRVSRITPAFILASPE
jgi:hypothetical protein